MMAFIARSENKVLKSKVEELTTKVKELTLDNATLKAELEIYRKEAALPSFSNLALGQATSDDDAMESTNNTPGEEFVSSGNDVYPTDPTVSLPNITGMSNPLCCALNKSDNILAVGGADRYVSVLTWGSALAPSLDATTKTVANAARVQCSAPVICVGFCNTHDILCVGCMDGSVHFVGFSLTLGKMNAWLLNSIGRDGALKFAKYIKSVAWLDSSPVVAISSADGTVVMSNISLQDEDVTMEADDDNYDDNDHICKHIEITNVKSFHFNNPVETLCFVNEGKSLCLYERETSFLTYFDLSNEYKMSKYSLNGKTTGGFDDFVSFAIMDLSLSPNGKYLCAATDASRNIIIEVGTDNIIRDLYGHKNDPFSQPRIAWSSNGQYIFGNSQEDNSICVWDVASTKIIQRLQHHSSQVRDIFGSKESDTLVTASYDKTCTVWLNAM
jgi:WD40 repeat protein